MKNKYITAYGVIALLVVIFSVVWFISVISSEIRRGSSEAEKTFSWLSREAEIASLAEGFMSDAYIARLSAICHQSSYLSAVVINGPSGTVFAWPPASPLFVLEDSGRTGISDTGLLTRVFSRGLDIGDGRSGSVIMTSALAVIKSDSVFAASRNSFMIILAVLLLTVIVLIVSGSDERKTVPASYPVAGEETPLTVTSSAAGYTSPQDTIEPFDMEADESSLSVQPDTTIVADDIQDNESPPETERHCLEDAEPPTNTPEGLFSPITGIGWQQYLEERLDAELVRAASSEQDLSLVIVRIAGLARTDLLARKVSAILLQTFKFRDMLFEFAQDGFAGILQNVHLDQAMKTADALYAEIDTLIMEMGYTGRITIGITTRTARLLGAARMIEEAVSAARKACEEPDLPIVAFRANPEKYRNFVAEHIQDLS